MICDKRTENHNFTITTNTSQHVEFFHSLILLYWLGSDDSDLKKKPMISVRLLSLFHVGQCLPNFLFSLFNFQFPIANSQNPKVRIPGKLFCSPKNSDDNVHRKLEN